MNNGIENKVILITGGSTGLGAETARLLAQRGAKVAVAARRKTKLDEVVAGIEAKGGTARAYALDVTDKVQVEAVVAAVVADFGKLDVLINNAGLMPIRPMAEVNTDEWDAMIDVNLKGTLYGIAAALPRFIAQDSGHIINLSYRRRDDIQPLLKQTDASFYWSILRQYALIGRFDYDLEEHRTIEALGGLEYSDCCLQIRIVGRKFLSTPGSTVTPDAQSDEGIFIQVVFKGLASLGGRIDSMIRS